MSSAPYAQGIPCPPASMIAQSASDLDAFSFNNYGRYYTVWSHSTFEYAGLNWHVAVDSLYADPSDQSKAFDAARSIVTSVTANSSMTAWKESYDRLLCSYESPSQAGVFAYVIISD